MKPISDEARFSRRRFFANTSALGVATFLGLPRIAAAEPPPETTKIRLIHTPAACTAPQYIAKELLHAEGFSEVQYVPFAAPAGTYTPMGLSGQCWRESGGFHDGRNSVVAIGNRLRCASCCLGRDSCRLP